MLWAIDVGNTQTVVGLWDGAAWIGQWRLETDRERTEDEWAAQLKPLLDLAGLTFRADRVVVASVVPVLDRAWSQFAAKHLGVDAEFLRTGEQVGIEVVYDPPHGVGADRIANALAAWDRYGTACVVVDFGTATTFDVVDHAGRYVGGAIMPGPMVALESLTGRTAKLPSFALETPEKAIGTNTVTSLQSGFMFGYAGGIDAVARRIAGELGGTVRVISTGGLGSLFLGLAQTIAEHVPTLTLDGLRLASERLTLPVRDR